jgi:hypothetical protein
MGRPRIITSDTSPEWAALFTGFRHSAFRLEGLQHYTGPPAEAEAFARFHAGQDPQVDLSWWLGLARKHTAAGGTMSRVRVVVEPASPYTLFELELFPQLAAAGDDIQIIPVAPGAWPTGLPHYDFWLFDDQDVWILTYNEDGAFVQAELRDDRQAVADHRRQRDAALRHAVPVNDYLRAAAQQAS